MTKNSHKTQYLPTGFIAPYDRLDDITHRAVCAALKILDAEYGHPKANDPMGDALANALDTIIKDAITE